MIQLYDLSHISKGSPLSGISTSSNLEHETFVLRLIGVFETQPRAHVDETGLGENKTVTVNSANINTTGVPVRHRMAQYTHTFVTTQQQWMVGVYSGSINSYQFLMGCI